MKLKLLKENFSSLPTKDEIKKINEWYVGEPEWVTIEKSPKEVDSDVWHKEYGYGKIIGETDSNYKAKFGDRIRIFGKDAFEKGYLKKLGESLKESLEDGISAALRDLINQENDLLNQYESAQVTLEDNGEARFNDIFDYIKDDINIHIGMLQSALEDINPSTEKIDDGKDQGEQLILDEAKNPITGKQANQKPNERIIKGKYCDFKADGTPILKYNSEIGAVVVPTEMKDFWDSL